MKTLRLIVSLRLAFFPLVLNLSFAQENVNNDTGSESMTDQDWNIDQNENEVEPRLKWVEDIQDKPNLIISEVYRLGSTEWIEITNLSQSDFDGTLEFSGANNYGNILYADVEIQWYESIILSSVEDIGMINWNINSFYPKKISITDWKAISIELKFSWNTINTFEVEESDVSKNLKKTPRPSFQRIYNDWREIQITSEADLYNISWYIANPWKIVIKSWNPWIWDWPSVYPPILDNSWGWNDSWNSNEPWNWGNSWSGDNPWNENETWWSSDFNLIISEIFYDDEDEWIEIYNIWTWGFFGDLTISWDVFLDDKTEHTYQNVHIPANDFLIIADSDEMFGFDWDVNILLNDGEFPQFSIPDDQEIQIYLLLSWEQIDSFFAHEYRVNKRDDFGVSFHKILTKNWPIVTRSMSNDDANLSDDTYNSANPWVFYTSAENIIDYAIDPNASSSEPEENSDMVGCSNVEDDIITISEVFRWWSRYEPYIEFFIHEDIEREYDELLLSGSLLTQNLTINLDEETETYDREKLQKNTRLVLTAKEWELTEAGLITIVLQPDLKFNSFSWELELFGYNWQSRQVLDIVKITNWAPEKSTYTAGSNHRCWIVMDNVMDFSPGFDESALKYFSVTSKYNEKVVETVKYVWWWGGCSCPSKADLCGNAVETGNETTPQPQQAEQASAAPLTGSENSPLTGGVSQSDEGVNSQEIPPTSPLTEGGQEVPQWQQIKIVSLEPKSPESITLQSFLPYDIDFKNHNYYLKTSTATTKKYIDGILYANSIDTFTKNFWFLDAGACVYMYSWDVQLDSYCYSTEKEKSEKEKQEVEIFNPSDYQLSITYIDYDPDWSDTWNEKITIQSKSSKSLDLSKIKMKINATNKKLTGILEPNSEITLSWTFWFPNSTKDGSDVVVILFYDNYIFSTYTYNPNKPKVEIPDGAIKVYSVIDGDTFRYRKEDGTLQSVRLLGVDAPESNTARYRTTECFWKEAKTFLTNLIKNQYVTLEFDSNSASSDAYGRMLAYVYLDWKLVNETLIAEWYAKEYTYKTDYIQQSAFKQAEENAKKSEKWLRSSVTCWKSIEEEPEAWGVDYEKLSIKISNVIYDPDGTDAGNEIVQLRVDNSQISTVSSIDFSDDFSLIIFPRSEYATWTTKNKKLIEFWLFDISTSSEITLKWNFQLPNNRATCVSLNQWSYTFDTWCYNPNWQLSDDEIDIQAWETLTFIPNVKIQSILPNPSWTDSGKEEITLLRTPSDDFPESSDLLDLSPDFSLLINDKTKKKLLWNLIPNQKISIKWSFSMPNTASCVSLLFQWKELDRFCYWKASDWVKFNSDNTSVHEIPAEELAIVKKITLVKLWDKLCVSYNKTLFSCKSIPNSTTEKNSKQLSMQNTFIAQLQSYLKSNYSMMYYDSDLKDYFDLYSEAKKAIKAGSGNFVRWEKQISVTNISSLFSDEYEQNAMDYFINQIQSILPENLSLALLQMKDEYTQKLLEKSDLSFLSLAE